MPSASPDLAHPPTDSANAWSNLVRETLHACTLHREGRLEASRRIVRDRLPALIRVWSNLSLLTVAARQAQLRQLFTQVQTAVDLGWYQRELIVAEVTRRLSPSLPAATAHPRANGAIHLQRRVPVGDIPAMLDALAEAEELSRADEILPARAVVPLAWQILFPANLDAAAPALASPTH